MNRGVLVPIISMKLSRSSDIHRYFLSVEFFQRYRLGLFSTKLFRGSDLVYFQKFGLNSALSRGL